MTTAFADATTMSLVVTLIGPRNGTDLVRDAVESVRAAISRSETSEPVWLSPDEACDIAVRGNEAIAVDAAASAATVGMAIDVVCQPAANRRKRLLVADMDSTIIQQECIDEIADFAGRRADVAEITERAMRGEIDFADAVRARAGMFHGLDAGVLERAYAERVTLTPGAVTVIRTMRHAGAFTALVSGGFTFFTGRVAARVGFDVDHGNVLEIVDGRLTGRVVEPIMGADAKIARLDMYRQKLGLPVSATMAVGDGANDIGMIVAAGIGVAFHAKPKVAAAAPARINHGDLTALLYLQGYARSEFID
jgi:phosphoserine phosphatase